MLREKAGKMNKRVVCMLFHVQATREMHELTKTRGLRFIMKQSLDHNHRFLFCNGKTA